MIHVVNIMIDCDLGIVILNDIIMKWVIYILRIICFLFFEEFSLSPTETTTIYLEDG